MKTGKAKKLTVVAESRNLLKVRDFVVKYSGKMGLLPRQVSEVKLAVDEAVSNIIRHAYVGKRGNVEIVITKLESAVEIKVMDKGVEFDWNSVLEPDLYRYVETRRKGGLGIWLIKRLMDEVTFERVGNTNVLIMRVYLKVEEAALVKAGKARVSIRTRFALYAVALITVLIFVVYIIGSRYQVKTINDRFIERYKAVTAQVAETTEDLILQKEYDYLALGNLVSSVKNSEAPIEYIVIADEKGVIIAHTDDMRRFENYTRPRNVRPVGVKEPVEVFTYARSGKEYKDFAAAIKDNNLKLGEVHLGIPEDKFAEVNNLVAQRLRVAFIALFFWSTTIVGVFVLGSTFISPIRKLAEQISRISLTGQATELRLATRNPEVSRIGEAFNEIMRNLRVTQGQLTDQTRLRRELQLAQEIQNALLPKSVPKLEGFELDAAYRAALEVGGDYYDFFEVDENAIGIVVADVSGKGIGSSMVMTMIRTSMRLEARGNKRASDVVNKVNRVAMKDMKKGMYVTMFYVILDSKKRMVSYASAGHNPMLLYRGDAKSVSFLNPGGIAVGIDLGTPDEFKKFITSEKLKLKKGDMLLIYTDGITEAMNEKREQFGEQRLLDLIYKYNHLHASEFKQKLNDEIATFTKGYPQSDDITFVVVKLEMSPAEIEYSKRIHLFQLLDDDVPLDEALEQTGISEEEYRELRETRESKGDEALKTEGIEEEVQQKHATHEQVRSIAKIVRTYPDYGVGRIKKLLETPDYGSHAIKESVIKRELIRMKLDTQEKREAFAKRELPTWASYK